MGLNQQELADLVGVSRRAVTNWETAVAEPRGSNLRSLEAVLATKPDESDDDEDAVLRRIDDGKFWAEATRRFFRGSAANAGSTSAKQPSPGRGEVGYLPDHLRRAQSDERSAPNG